MSYIFNGQNWALDVPDNIPSLLGSHLYITGVTLLFGVLIAFAFAFLIMRFPRLYLPIITTAGIVYTLPSVAVVAFLIAITGLSDTTLIIPLVAYAQVVLIRNIVTGIRSVDPSLVEVGRAMGMNERQLQARVVLPLALPVIVAGVRVVAVTTIGIAAIGPLVGVDDLGRLIFQGSTFSNTDQIEAGAILITALALVTDFILLGVQRLLNPGRVGVARA